MTERIYTKMFGYIRLAVSNDFFYFLFLLLFSKFPTISINYFSNKINENC